MRNTVLPTYVLAMVLATSICVPEARAQEPAPEYYGVASTNYHYISAEEFQETSRGYYRLASDGFWARVVSADYYHHVAPLRLPTGALVDGYTVIYEDSDAVYDLSLELYRHWVGSFGATGTVQIGTTFTSTGTPGIRSDWVDLDPNPTIKYLIAATSSTQSYVFKLQLQVTTDLRFRGVIVHWYRQISPAPAVATFDDVPLGAFGFAHVEALVASGITAGCDATHFCPNQPLTRVQMAVFLAKALGLHWAP